MYQLSYSLNSKSLIETDLYPTLDFLYEQRVTELAGTPRKDLGKVVYNPNGALERRTVYGFDFTKHPLHRGVQCYSPSVGLSLLVEFIREVRNAHLALAHQPFKDGVYLDRMLGVRTTIGDRIYGDKI